jgi:hypothetical protein
MFQTPLPSLRAQRSNPWLRTIRYGLLRRCAPRNDEEADGVSQRAEKQRRGAWVPAFSRTKLRLCIRALRADLPSWQSNFGIRAAANQPDGQITSDYQKSCQAPESKIFLFSSDPNQFTDSLSRPTRGAIARRHERGAGCGGRESVRRATAIAGRDEPRERCAACRMIGAFCVRQNRVVLAPIAGVKLAEAKSGSTGFDQPLIRQRRWQNELVAGESTA